MSSRKTSTAPAAAPVRPTIRRAGSEVWGQRRSMATDVTIRAGCKGARDDASEQAAIEAAVKAALALFGRVDRTCTRFDPSSALMQLNARPRDWVGVAPECFKALVAAQHAHQQTQGRFDPRVLEALVALGYDRTLPFGREDVVLGGSVGFGRPRPAQKPWRPRFRGATSEVRLDGSAVDLGGIGKGLAVRWASELLRPVAPDHLVEAGGDCHCSGTAPDGGDWLIGVEDPRGGSDPIAVLALRDRAVTTSSVRLRHWKAAGKEVHHLIDPRTGRPGGDGLLAVTVVGADAAMAEVWSKVLFLEGPKKIAGLAARRSLAALWVTKNGELLTSRAAERYVAWRCAA